jgi:hypothetical protein
MGGGDCPVTCVFARRGPFATPRQRMSYTRTFFISGSKR